MRAKPWPMLRYHRISQVCGLPVLIIGCTALIGWFSGSVTLRGIKTNYIPMAPNTAFVLILLGGILATFNCASRKFLTLARIGISLSLVIVVARLTEYLTGFDFDVDRWIFNFPAEHLGLAPVGKMAFFTSATFLFLALAMLLITWTEHRWVDDAARGLAAIVTFVGLVFSLGYIYGAPLMYRGTSIPMALNTALAFLFCGPGVIVRASIIGITERRRAEAALAESEERYRLLFESNPHPIWVYDIKTLAFLAVNQAAIASYGYSREEFLGLTISDIRPREDVPALLANVSNVCAHGVDKGCWRHQKKDGEIIDVEITSHQIVFGRREAEIVLANDITERKRTEDAINQLNGSLEQRSQELAQANSELEAFSYSVSHDLRAPLRAIDGFSRILIEDYAGKLDAEAERLFEVIRTNTQNMGRLIDDLLAFSRLGRKQIERSSIDMNELAEGVYAQIDPQSGQRSSKFSIEVLPRAEGDPAMVRQVFTNLISNAMKYSQTNQQPLIRVGGFSQDGENVYFVRDNGVGFEMDYAHKLFGVFQRLHSAEEFEGTGVGLAIVQRIVHRHGGRVWAEAKPNEGATFYFTLPRRSEVHARPAKLE